MENYSTKPLIMKNSILLLILLNLLISCNKNDQELAPASLIGTWKLTEMLQDPGDGSGTFQPVNSNKKIVFVISNQVTSNGVICDMSINSDTFSTGSYSEATKTINPYDCQNLTINYEVDASSLILSYRCIEGCRAKYIKVE
jgi:Lipocalin-like domain